MNDAREFISSYARPNSLGEIPSSFRSSRIVIERLLLWAWIIKSKSVDTIGYEEFREFIAFSSAPPSDWVGDVARHRFRWVEEVGYLANPAWRPFCKPIDDGGLRTESMFELVITYCASFYDFLINKRVCDINPARNFEKLSIQSLTAVSRPIDRGLTVWHVEQVLRIGSDLKCGRHERALFIVAMIRYLLMPLRLIAHNPNQTPSLSLFSNTEDGIQYSVDGLRGIQMITAPTIFGTYLERYRLSRGLPRITPTCEMEPLLVTTHGRAGLTQRQIRNIVNELILVTIEKMEDKGCKSEDTAPLKSSCIDSIRIASIADSLLRDGVYSTQEKLGKEIFSSVLRRGL
ncbi:hypothetical protein [Pseudomonas qingdaonensis]|uniref:hypothetical protein n=1 Tax=Pseudomonas qingdaonensis TaxID=2056231 RepID=UPI0028E66848|nr:hypothetical protein [Pseudomonas qingdaonensis]MEC6742983.1 hypothetical protein [Pseudomonas qingdaonensis]